MGDTIEQESRVPSHQLWQTIDQTSDPQWFIKFLDASRGAALAAIQQDPRQFYSYLDVQEGNHILDVGAGTGELTRPLCQLVGPAGRIVGIDYSQTMIDEARRRAQEAGSPAQFQQGDIHHLDFEDSTFDRVQVRLVFQHLPEPRQPLAEIIRVTKPGGKIAIIEQDWETLMIDAGNRAVTRKIVNFFCDILPNGWIGRELSGLFKEAGLTDVTAVGATTILPPDYDLVKKLLGLGSLLEQAQREGLLSADEAAEWNADQEKRARQRRFFAAFVLFTVTGRKANS